MPYRFASLLLIAALAAPAARAAEAYWQGVATDVAAKIATVRDRYDAGDEKAARQALTEAYFGEFEDRKMEAAIRKEIGADRARQLEALFGALRKAIKARDGAAVQRLASELDAGLSADGKQLDAAGVPPEVFAVNR